MLNNFFPEAVAPLGGPGGVSSRNVHETRGEVSAPGGGPSFDGPRYDALNGQFNMSVLIVSPCCYRRPHRSPHAVTRLRSRRGSSSPS